MGVDSSLDIRAYFGLLVGQITRTGGLSVVWCVCVGVCTAVGAEKLYNVLPVTFVHMAAAFQNI